MFDEVKQNLTLFYRNYGNFVLLEFEKIQFEGFHRFIFKGLIEELNFLLTIEDIDQEFECQLFGKEYRLAGPLTKERQ